jgi:hypothetical protein
VAQCFEDATPEYQEAYDAGYRAGSAKRNEVPKGQEARVPRPGQEIEGRIILTFVDGDPPSTKTQYYTGNKEELDRIEAEENQKINDATMKGFKKALGVTRGSASEGLVKPVRPEDGVPRTYRP